LQESLKPDRKSQNLTGIPETLQENRKVERNRENLTGIRKSCQEFAIPDKKCRFPPNTGHKTRNSRPKQINNGSLLNNIGHKRRNTPSKQLNTGHKHETARQNKSTMGLC
jgi:hypothetical protein